MNAPAPGRTYTWSFGTITLAEGLPEMSPEQLLMIEQTWKERAARLLEQVVMEVLGPQPRVLGGLSEKDLEALAIGRAVPASDGGEI